MDLKKPCLGLKLIGISLLLFLFLALQSSPLKVKVVVDNASIKATPEIGGRTLIRVSLNTVLEAEVKEREWYKVIMEKEGMQISGFIHEMLVEVIGEGDLAEEGIPVRAEKPQVEIIAEVEVKIDDNRKLIRQDREFEKAVEYLKPLVAKVFKVMDNKKQKELATEIFLWTGLAYAGLKDEFMALTEFKNMFEVNHAYAKEITRNIYDPNVNILINQAEKEFLGLVTEYSFEISTVPKEAEIKINGEEIGLSPEVYRTAMPKFSIEIGKEGYRAIKEEIFLTQPNTKKNYTLELIGKDVEVKSNPVGAKIYLDGKDTEKVTDYVLFFVPFGVRKIKLIKENYAEWEDDVEVERGEEPVIIEVNLTAKKYVYRSRLGKSGQKLFQQPTGITIDRGNNIYVVDMSDSKIKKFTPEGKLQINWGRRGKEFKSLKNPSGIAVDSRGFLYVADSRNHCVMKYDKAGVMIKKWGKEGSRAEELRSPSDIAVDSNNDIYVADSGNHHIKKYSLGGVLKKVWGKQGASDGDFVFPTAIAVSQKDEIFVLDRSRVQKFSSEGEFIASWGKIGADDGEFNKPKGIFIDMDNYVYVADSANNRIQKFDESGGFITKWGSRGTNSGLMNFPCGLVIDDKGYVFVVERDNNRIQIFSVASSSETESDQ